jgi:predicted  nucleic acid-binding Zn-ribbon protein
MPVTLPIDVYETFEKNFGKEDARQLVKSFEIAIDERTEYKWAVTRDEILSRVASKEEIRKLEKNIQHLSEEIRDIHIEMNTLAKKEAIDKLATKEEISKLATKEEISKLATKAELNTLRMELKKDIENLRIAFTGKLEKLKAEIETKIAALDRKFTIMLAVLFFTIIFLNQNALTFLAKVLGLVK